LADRNGGSKAVLSLVARNSVLVEVEVGRLELRPAS
jgi:hypothetical protein